MKTIIYDFDGTIADNLTEGLILYNRIAKEKGLREITSGDKEILREKGPREIMSYLGIKVYQLPGLALRLRKDLKKVILNLKAHYGIGEVLKVLDKQHFRQMILTSNDRENVEGFLNKYNLNVFDQIICGSSVFGKAKILLALLKNHDLKKDDVVYVGDEIRDVEAANKAGIRMIAVGWGYNTAEALRRVKPFAVVENTDQLLQTILAL